MIIIIIIISSLTMIIIIWVLVNYVGTLVVSHESY